MAARRSLAFVTALAASSSLLLSACGGGGETPSTSGKPSKSGKAGAPDQTSPAKSSGVPSGRGGAPRISLPPDVALDIAKPDADARSRAALADLSYAIAALIDGKAKGDGGTASMRHAFDSEAGRYWAEAIEDFRKSGRTITGSYRYYGLETDLVDRDSADARYCEDQRVAYPKDRKTGKVFRTEPSNDDFFLYTLKLRKVDGVWKVAQVQWAKGDASCVRR
ncbi:hypothetical protein [Streptomyces sp. NPDC047108]|uniref:hypothetical protein n=1 Tax=Streptomyces sp. NPDC047108 TaxID=3155025 RepID=UPI0033EA9031